MSQSAKVSASDKSLLKSIDRSTDLGRRDYALFAFMFNTPGPGSAGCARCRCASRGSPQVRLLGKGRKERICPLWPATARLMRDLIAARSGVRGESDSPLVFRNARGGRSVIRPHLTHCRRSRTTALRGPIGSVQCTNPIRISGPSFRYLADAFRLFAGLRILLNFRRHLL
jgi:integrase